nr:mutant BasR [Neisseria gonorrhoeae]
MRVLLVEDDAMIA